MSLLPRRYVWRSDVRISAGEPAILREFPDLLAIPAHRFTANLDFWGSGVQEEALREGLADTMGSTEEISTSPFHNIFRLFVGDFSAKALSFLAYIYLARILGVQAFGVLVFAGSLITYFLLLADAGVEAWATREVAQVKDVRALVGRVMPLRFLLAVMTFAVLLVVLAQLPNSSELRWTLGLFGLTVFTQAACLKWVFLGHEKMTRVSAGLLVAQVVFSAAVIVFIRGPETMVWVPILRLAGELSMALYFWRLFAQANTRSPILWTYGKDAAVILPQAVTIGASQVMGLLRYNFDSVLLGFLVGVQAVGLYGAAYRPVNMGLAVATSYAVGLLPALARTANARDEFHALMRRSVRICSIFAIPIGVGGALLADPVILFLFGASYEASVAPLRILVWSAAFLLLRSSYRAGLRATHHQDLELRSAVASAALNVGLNLLLIPRYGMVGAAWATFVAEAVLCGLVYDYFHRAVMPLNPLPLLVRPLVAGGAMIGILLLTQPVFWMARGLLAVAVYFTVLLITGEEQTRQWVRLLTRSTARLGRELR